MLARVALLRVVRDVLILCLDYLAIKPVLRM